MYNVAIYARISSEKQNKELSIPAQLHECHRYAETHNWQVVKEYQDIGSGRNDNRKQFLKMMADAENEEFSLILVHDFSRFARNKKIHILSEEKLAEYGVKVISVSEPFGDGPSERLVKGVITEYNQFFSENLAFHTKKGQLQRLRQGQWPGLPPIGYKKDGANVVIDEVKGAKIRYAFEQYATGKYSLKTWADEAYELGYRTRKETKITLPTWADIFSNAFYIGKMVWKEQEYEGGHEKLVNMETFNQVQQILADRGPVIHSRNFYLLASMLWSEDSNSRMVGQVATNGSGKPIRYYKSTSKTRNDIFHYAQADKVEGHFAKFLFNVYVNLERLNNRVNIDPEIFLSLKVARSVGDLYIHLQDYQRVYLNKLLVLGRGIHIKADKVVSIELSNLFYYDVRTNISTPEASRTPAHGSGGHCSIH